MKIYRFLLFIICCQAYKKNNWTYKQWKSSHGVKQENAEKRSPVVPKYNEISIDTTKLFHDFVNAFEAENDEKSQNEKQESRRTKVNKNKKNSDGSVRNLVYPGPSLSSPTAAAFDPYLMKQPWTKDPKGASHGVVQNMPAIPKSQPVLQPQVSFAPSLPASPPNGFFLPPSFSAVVPPAPHAQSMVNTVFTAPVTQDLKPDTSIAPIKDEKEPKSNVKTGSPTIEKVINNPRNTPAKSVPSHEKKKKKTANGNKRVYSLGDHIFSDVGCFLDKWIRAVPTLEGNHPLLMDSDYKSRSDPLQKCAEAALDKGFQVFGLQNGGQCFAGINGETTYDMYGPSNQCQEDGLGGSWAMEMYRYSEDVRNNRNKQISPESHKIGSQKENTPKVHHSDNEDRAERKEEDEFDKSLFKEEQELDIDDNKKKQHLNPTEPLSAHGISFKGVLGKLIRKAVSESKMKTAIEPEESSEDHMPKKAGKIEKSVEETKSASEKPVEKKPIDKPAKVESEEKGKKKETELKDESDEKNADKNADKTAAKAVDSLKAVTELFKSAISEKVPPGKYGDKPVVKNDTVVNFVKDDEPTKNEVGQTHSRFYPLGALVSKGLKPPCICPDKICSSKLDLAFVIDASAGSEQNGKDKMAETMEFGRRVASAFKVDQENSHLGLVTYATDAQIMLNFHHFNDPDTLTEARDAVRVKPHTGKYTGQALSLAKEGLFDKGHRPDALDVLILMTDGPSSDDITEPSRALRDMGVKIIAVGIGNQIDRKQLNDVASDPDEEHVFTADYDNLATIIRRTQRAACVGGTLRDPVVPCNCEAQADVRADVQTAAFYNMYKAAVETPLYTNVAGVTRYNIPRPAISHKKAKLHRKSEVEGNRHHFLRTLPLDNPHPPIDDSSPIHELHQKESPSAYPIREHEVVQSLKMSKDEDGAVAEIHHDPMKEEADPNLEGGYAIDVKAHGNRLGNSEKNNYLSDEQDLERQRLQGDLEYKNSKEPAHDEYNSFKSKEREIEDFSPNYKENVMSVKQQEDMNDSDLLTEKNKALKSQKTSMKILSKNLFENSDSNQLYSSDEKQIYGKKQRNPDYQTPLDVEQGVLLSHGGHGDDQSSSTEQSNKEDSPNNEIIHTIKKPRVRNSNNYDSKEGNKKLDETQAGHFNENQRVMYKEKEDANESSKKENEKNSEREDERNEKISEEKESARESKDRKVKNENQMKAQKERKESFQEEENEQKAINKENSKLKLAYDDSKDDLHFQNESPKQILEEKQVSEHPNQKYSSNIESETKSEGLDKDSSAVEKEQYVTKIQKQTSKLPEAVSDVYSNIEEKADEPIHERVKPTKLKMEKESFGKQPLGVEDQPSSEVFDQPFTDSKKETFKDNAEQGVSNFLPKAKIDQHSLTHGLASQDGKFPTAAVTRGEKTVEKGGQISGESFSKFEDNLKQLSVLHIPDEKLAHLQADPVEPVHKIHHAYTAEESLQLRLDEEKEKVHQDTAHLDDHQDEVMSIENQHLSKEDQEQLHAIQATLMNADNQLLESNRPQQSLDGLKPLHPMDSLQLGINLGKYVHGNSDGSLQQIPLLAKEDASQIVKYKGYSNVISEGYLKAKDLKKVRKTEKKKIMGLKDAKEQKKNIFGEDSQDALNNLKENSKSKTLQRNMLISDDVQTHPERTSFQIISKAMQTIADKELPSILDDTMVLHDNKMKVSKDGKENMKYTHESSIDDSNRNIDEISTKMKANKLNGKEKGDAKNEDIEFNEERHRYKNNMEEKKGEDDSTKEGGNEIVTSGRKIKNANFSKKKIKDQEGNKNQIEDFEHGLLKGNQQVSENKFSKDFKEDKDSNYQVQKEEFKGAKEELKNTNMNEENREGSIDHSAKKNEKELEKDNSSQYSNADRAEEEKNIEDKKAKEEEDMNKMQEGEQRFDPIQKKKSKGYNDIQPNKENNQEMKFNRKEKTEDKSENYPQDSLKHKESLTYEKLKKDEPKRDSDVQEKDNREKDNLEKENLEKDNEEKNDREKDNREKDHWEKSSAEKENQEKNDRENRKKNDLVKENWEKDNQEKASFSDEESRNSKSGKKEKEKFLYDKPDKSEYTQKDQNHTESFEKETSFDERNNKELDKVDERNNKKIKYLKKIYKNKETAKDNDEDKNSKLKEQETILDSKNQDNLKANEGEQNENKDHFKSSRNVESLHEDSMAPLYEMETKNDKNFYHGNDEASMFQKRLEEAQKFDSIKSQSSFSKDSEKIQEKKLQKEDTLKAGNILNFEQSLKMREDEDAVNEGKRKTETSDSEHELRSSEEVSDYADNHSKDLYFLKSKKTEDYDKNRAINNENEKKDEDLNNLSKKYFADKNTEKIPEESRHYEENSDKSTESIRSDSSNFFPENSVHEPKYIKETTGSRRLLNLHKMDHERKSDARDVSMDNKLVTDEMTTGVYS